jgi:hypothetical protein
MILANKVNFNNPEMQLITSIFSQIGFEYANNSSAHTVDMS